MSTRIKEEKKAANKLQWFFFVIVIPIIFSITLLLVILTIAGVDISKMAEKFGSNIPIISAFMDDDKESEKKDDPNKQIANLKKTMKDYEEQIAGLEADLKGKEQEIKKKQQQIEQLTNDESKQIDADNSRMEKVKALSKSYSEMDPEAAALIFNEMESNLAVDILSHMKAENRGNILGAMDPKKAAAISQNFVED
jgi:flagellar protein FlbB